MIFISLKNTSKLRFERCEVLTEGNVALILLYGIMLRLFRRNIATFSFLVHKSGLFVKSFIIFLCSAGIFLGIP